MLVKTIVDEDFVNYYKPSMFIGTCYCNWKCCVENNLPLTTCQNNPLSLQPNIEISIEKIYQRYIKNPITNSIIIGGLEPFFQFKDVFYLVKYFRNSKCNDTIIIYTGYYPNEIELQVNKLKQFNNLIIKYGRFIPNSKPTHDEILGIELSSDNQYAERIS